MQQPFKQGREKITSLRKPYYWHLLVYGIIKDTVRLLKVLLVLVPLVILLAAIFYVLAPPEVFLKLASFYLPKVVLAASIIFTISSYTLRILIHWVSPKYVISDNSLKFYPREIKIIADPPYEKVELSRIKRIWGISSPVDLFFGKPSTTYLIGIELQGTYLGYPVVLEKSRGSSVFKKLLRMGGGSLSYRVILSIPEGQAFIRELGVKPENIEGSLFEMFVLLLSFV